jgi:muconate cycloisomerase
MRIREVTAHVVRLPLKRAFHHASASRHDSENVLVRATLADGTHGWGEGVPRSYVTGETPEGCLAQLEETPLAEQLDKDCNAWREVIELCERFQPAKFKDDPRECYGNALRCAVELSILDAYGRLFGEPVGAVVGHFPPAAAICAQHDEVRYSAVIDSGNHALWRKSLVRRLYGFRQCKVKVGAAGDDDVARLASIRRWSGERMDLRVDANEAWRPRDVLSKIEPLRRFSISAIEQPVPHAEVAALAELRSEVEVPIMLDESLTSLQDARLAIELQTCDMFNIRLSKCGGFLNSLRIAALASMAGMGYQLGCHPGESGVLSAAGRQWAANVANIRYLEGSYDRHLFRQLLTNEDVTFAYGGLAPRLNGPGLGVTVSAAALAEYSVLRRDFALE